MHHYHHLGDKLSRHPVGAPKTGEFIEILKILFKPDEIEDSLLAILDNERCIGCGLCISTCPGDALKLVTREDYEPPPASAGELVEQVIINKIKQT